jgi:DNA-binding transcriptional LysR family regulator
LDRFVALETFVCVYEAGSFSSASRRLHVGQPAVSKTIAQLEKHLGVQLLLRSSRGLTPTEAGQHFYERARRAIEEANEADLAARGASADLTGRLRVSGAVTFSRLHVLPRLKAFTDAHPGVVIDFMLDDRNIDLLEEGIDVSLRMGDLADSSMTARKIGQSARVVVGTPGYFKIAGEPQVPADLVAHEAIVYGQNGGGVSWSFNRGSTEVSVAVSGKVRVSAAEGVRAIVLADMGLAIASEWMFAPELATGAVKRVLTDWSLPPIDLWAVFPASRMASAKARAFVAFVEAALAGPASDIIPI